jgi:hypothetical protein
MQPMVVALPITLRNFLDYLVLSEEEWVGKWVKGVEEGNFRTTKHIVLDKQVVHEDELNDVLRELTVLSPIEGVIAMVS